MPFQSLPGKLWRVEISVSGERKNLFLTAPNMVAAIGQAKSLDPNYKIGGATEAEYIKCAPAPVTTVMWVPKK
jgi:hypothetical protein